MNLDFQAGFIFGGVVVWAITRLDAWLSRHEVDTDEQLNHAYAEGRADEAEARAEGEQQ